MSADELTEASRKAAASIQRHASTWKRMGAPDQMIKRHLHGIEKRHHIELPNKVDLQQVVNRLCDSVWWRRALRKRFRTVEYAAIQTGSVHARAGKYVSDKTMARAIRDKRRIAELLESLVAVNQSTGEMLPMDELAEQSLSNPANRRRATMVRIKGIEQHAKSNDKESLFLTITCPSRMHARHNTGAVNDRYDGTGPRQAQAYLNHVWRIAMRKLMHDGVRPCGMRVVEPHHDGCPHWHILVFTEPAHSESVIRTLHDYALRDSPNEPGAVEHRFKVERIDPAKGSAVSYVAKYVSKSIDGEGVDFDDETGATGKDAAMRIVAWARTWGIRQFQFFGVPAITPSRELYRLPHINTSSQGLSEAHQAIKANDYGKWLHVCDAFELGFKSTYTERKSNRYEGETVQRIQGLTARAKDLCTPAILTTRFDEWRVQPRKDVTTKEEIPPPWTRFNNCAPIDLIDLFPPSMEVDQRKHSRHGECGGRKVPRDGHRYQTRGGSIGDRTPQSIAKPPNHARTVTAAAPQGESHA